MGKRWWEHGNIYNLQGEKIWKDEGNMMILIMDCMILVGSFKASEKYEFVSCDDEIPNWMETQNMFQTTNQSNQP